jgi:hypothetical protein
MDTITIIIIVAVIIICLSCMSSSYMMVKYSPPPQTTSPPEQPEEIVTPPLDVTTTPPPPPVVTTTTTTTTTLPPSPTVPVEEMSLKLNRITEDINTQFAWKSMKNVGDRDIRDLKFNKTCLVPWNGVYQIGCTIDGVTVKSNIWGPVNDGNGQSPILRIGAYGNNNLCSKLGGRISVYRQRPNENYMTDITQYLTDTTNTKPYNKKDPLFLDNYRADC